MRSTITNRMLAEATGYTHTQVRRWVVSFLPPDPKIGQFAGVSREHSIDEAVQVILGGKLIELGLSIEDAREVLSEAMRVLKIHGWPPSQGTTVETVFPVDAILAFGKARTGKFHYELKIVWSRGQTRDPGRIVEEYEITSFGDRRAWNRPPLYLPLSQTVAGVCEDINEYLKDAKQ